MTVKTLSGEGTAVPPVGLEAENARLRGWLEAQAKYNAQDAKELRAEAAKLRKRGEEADAMFKSGCADYAASFAGQIRKLLAAAPAQPLSPPAEQGAGAERITMAVSSQFAGCYVCAASGRFCDARQPKAEPAAPPRENPHQHVNLSSGLEVCLWPDGVIGVSRPGTVVNFLCSPSDALALADALVKLAAAPPCNPPADQGRQEEQLGGEGVGAELVREVLARVDRRIEAHHKNGENPGCSSAIWTLRGLRDELATLVANPLPVKHPSQSPASPPADPEGAMREAIERVRLLEAQLNEVIEHVYCGDKDVDPEGSECLTGLQLECKAVLMGQRTPRAFRPGNQPPGTIRDGTPGVEP